MLRNQLVIRNKITFRMYSCFQALFECMKYNVAWISVHLYSRLSEGCSWSFQCLFPASCGRVGFFRFIHNSGNSVNWMVLFWYWRTILPRLFLSLSAIILVCHKFAFRTDFATSLFIHDKYPGMIHVAVVISCFDWVWAQK